MISADATINGRPVVACGQTILQAAAEVGVIIPTLCHTAGLSPEGGCRICLVEIDGQPRPQAACHTPLRAGMHILTQSPRLLNLRRDVLSLMISDQPPGTFSPNASGDVIERLMADLDLQRPAFGACGAGAMVDESHPYMRFDPRRCITCRQCLNVCEQIQGQFVYGVANRGDSSRLIFGPAQLFAQSECTSCGACVSHCPTGAITDRDRIDRMPASSATESVCGYCGVGCRVRIETAANRVVRIDGVPEAAVNAGHLCAKGKYAHAYHHHPDRLLTPLLRENGALHPVPWEQAIDWLARRLTQIRDSHGPDSLGVITSSRSTNEACYLLQKLFRTAIGTNNVDCCARVCHSSTALALQTVTGTSAASASYDDIERATCIVVAGANPTEAHPVVGARIKQAAMKGTPLLVIDPRRIELADFATVHLQLRPGTNVALFNALTKLLIHRRLIDLAYLDERVEGVEALNNFLESVSLKDAAEITGVGEPAIEAAARLLGRGPALFVHGLGLSELTQGTASVMTLCNLAMITGSIGRRGSGMLPLRGQNNVQGNADMGAMPNQVTGYQSPGDPDVRARLAAIWGAPPPVQAGKTIPEMLESALEGELRGLWVAGEDIAQSDSNQSRVIRALERLELLVVQDPFMCETARYAHLILPSAVVLEQEGTFTNAERRIQHVRPAVHPPGEARADWRVVLDAARAMGQAWNYQSPADVMDEIAQVAPALFGGVHYSRLGGDGLQWPCPAADHPGTATVHADKFMRGKGQLVTVDFHPSPQLGGTGYPYVLITGRVLQQYNVGTMTLRTPSRQLAPTDVLEIHPDDAAARGIVDGDAVEASSRWGSVRITARVSPRVAVGTLFLSFHDPAVHVNRLLGPYADPQSKCPEFKLTAVRLARV